MSDDELTDEEPEVEAMAGEVEADDEASESDDPDVEGQLRYH
jgi:hypothetical protein